MLNRDCQGAIYGTTNGNLSVNVEEEIQLTLKLFEHEKLGVTTCLDEYDPYDAKSTCKSMNALKISNCQPQRILSFQALSRVTTAMLFLL